MKYFLCSLTLLVVCLFALNNCKSKKSLVGHFAVRTTSNQWKTNFKLGSNELNVYEEFIGFKKETGKTIFSGVVCNHPVGCIITDNEKLKLSSGIPNAIIYKVTNFDNEIFTVDSIDKTDCNGYFRTPINPTKNCTLIFTDGKSRGLVYVISKKTRIESRIEKYNFIECN